MTWKSLTKQESRRARDWLVQRVTELDPDGTAPILLGGVDSTTVLFAQLERGLKPPCLTFAVEGVRSVDMLAGQLVCQTFGCPHIPVLLPREFEQVSQSIQQTIKLIDWRSTQDIKKTIVQCVYPLLWTLPIIRQYSDRVLCGAEADIFFATTRKDATLLGQIGEEAFRVQRLPVTSFRPDSSFWHMRDVSLRWVDDQGTPAPVTMVSPYWGAEFTAWMWQFTVDVCNRLPSGKPMQKYALVSLFDDYWRQGMFYRPNIMFQIGAGIREQHDALLRDRTFNPQQHRGVIALYRDIADDLGLLEQVGIRRRSAAMMTPEQFEAMGAEARDVPDPLNLVGLTTHEREEALHQMTDAHGLLLPEHDQRVWIAVDADRPAAWWSRTGLDQQHQTCKKYQSFQAALAEQPRRAWVLVQDQVNTVVDLCGKRIAFPENV